MCMYTCTCFRVTGLKVIDILTMKDVMVSPWRSTIDAACLAGLTVAPAIDAACLVG